MKKKLSSSEQAISQATRLVIVAATAAVLIVKIVLHCVDSSLFVLFSNFYFSEEEREKIESRIFARNVKCASHCRASTCLLENAKW